MNRREIPLRQQTPVVRQFSFLPVPKITDIPSGQQLETIEKKITAGCNREVVVGHDLDVYLPQGESQ
jgi:hypothetical protein